MRRKQRLPIIFVAVGLVFLLVIALTSLVLSIVDYGASSSGSEDSEPSLALPYQPGDFTNAGSGWISYSHDGVEALHGVDISEHQANVDWTALKLAGADYAMIRVGYRGYTEGEIQPDDYFTQNIEGALAAGLDVGVYFFSQALDEKEAIDEANFVLESIKDYPLSYPVIFDWEDIQADARTDGMDSIQLTKNAIAFCGAVEKAGYRAGVYFNQRFGYEEFDLESLQDYVFWLAEYNETPSFSYHFQLWQYCNDGRVDGIQTDVDLNLAFLRAKH